MAIDEITQERTRPLIDWTPDFEKSLVYHIVAGTVLQDFPDLIDAQLFQGEEPSEHTTSYSSVLVQEALKYFGKHKQAPGSQMPALIKSLRRNKDEIPFILEHWEAIVQHEQDDPTIYEEMKTHLGARCLYRADRQSSLQKAEWLSQGEFETIEEWAKAQEQLQERIKRIEVAGNTKQPFKMTKAETFDAPPVEWVIEKLVPKGMLSMVAGKDGLGKSLLTMEMGKCVLPGGPEKFLGTFEILNRGPVLILAMDDPDSLINDRLKEMGIKNHPDLYVPQDIDYSEPLVLLKHVMAVSAEIKPALVIIDCLYRLLPKQANSNNDASLMVPLMNILNTVAEKTGAAVILIHHEKKNGDEIAGSFSIRASLKSLIRISKPKPPKPTRNDPFPEPPDESARVMGLDKSKLTASDSWTLHLEGVGKWSVDSGEPVTKTTLLENMVISRLQDAPTGMTKSELARSLGVSGKRYKDAVDMLDQLVYERKVVCFTERRPDANGMMKHTQLYAIKAQAQNVPEEAVILSDRDKTGKAIQALSAFYKGGLNAK